MRHWKTSGPGRYTVIVIAHSSRLDRRDVDVAQFYAMAIREAGGRIESVREPMFGQTDIGSRVLTLLAQHQNHEYSRTLAGHTRAGKARIAANGALDGRTPWGFTSTGPKYDRRLVPADAAREYVPQVYRRVIAGESLATICRWLESEHVAPAGIASDRSTRGKSGRWWPRSLGQLIRNPVYMGLRCDGNGQTVTTCEPLVDPHMWAMAGRSLDERPKRGPVVAENRCALSGAARCHACGSPLYRIRSQYGGSGPGHYLRCAGTGAARKGCGAPMIWLETAEALADEVIGGLREQIYEFRVVPGNEAEIDAQLASLDYERRQVALRGLSWADEDAERARIRAAYNAVAAAERVPDQRRAVWTGETYGDRWAKLEVDGRADWLRGGGGFTVYFTRGEADPRDVAAGRDGVKLILVWPDEDAVA